MESLCAELPGGGIRPATAATRNPPDPWKATAPVSAKLIAMLQPLDTDADCVTVPTSGLRVAWFGHGGGRRADGLSSYSAATVQGLRRHGVEVAFFSHRHDGDAVPVPRAVSLSAARFKTVVMPHPGTASRIADAIARFRPDVVHVSLSFSLLDTWLLTHCRRHGIPTVATVHLPYSGSGRHRGALFRALYRFHARTLSSADLCIALSNDQRELLVAVGCSRERVVVIPNGVDTAEIGPGSSPLRGTWGGDFTIGYLGRLDPEKRVLELVHSFQRQPWSRNSRLVIAGNGVQESRIKRMTTNNSRVIMLGAIHDRRRCIDLLRAIDAFVLPSTAEGLSLALLEAMAAGCPVVATDVGDDGRLVSGAGIVLPAHPLEPGLGRALAELHADAALRAQLGGLARARVASSYSMAGVVEALMSRYRELVYPSSAVA